MRLPDVIADRGRPPLQACFDRYADMRATRDRMLNLYLATAPPPSLLISGDRCEIIPVPDTPERAKLKTYIDDLTVWILNGEYSARMTANDCDLTMPKERENDHAFYRDKRYAQ